MAGPVYRAEAPDQLRRVELDGLTAVFNRRSGMTHIVAPPAPQILDALQKGPADADELLRRIRQLFSIDDGPSAGPALEARLAELEAVGLVSRL